MQLGYFQGTHGRCSSLQMSKGSLAFVSTSSQWPMVFAEPGPLSKGLDDTKQLKKAIEICPYRMK